MSELESMTQSGKIRAELKNVNNLVPSITSIDRGIENALRDPRLVDVPGTRGTRGAHEVYVSCRYCKGLWVICIYSP